jgi:hypothetical protein
MSGCGAFRLDFDGGLGGEAEETALFLPVMRQVFAQSHQPARRQRVGLTAHEERAHDFRAEIGQPNKRSEPALIPRTAAGSLEAVFESSDVERFGWILMEV